MTKRIAIIFVSIIVLSGCTNMNKKNNQYVNSKNFFPEELVSHFPENLCDSAGFESSVLNFVVLSKYCFDINKLIYSRIYSDTQYTAICKYVNLSNKAIYSAMDTSVIVLTSYNNKLLIEGELFNNLASPKQKKLASHNLYNAKGLPVPLFEIDEYFGETISGLSSGFDLFVLDAKAGKYLDDKYLYDSSEFLPKRWEHGFSRGIACLDKDKTIIYWIIVW